MRFQYLENANFKAFRFDFTNARLKAKFEVLVSYGTPIIAYMRKEKQSGKYIRLCDTNALTATTLRHIKEFNGFNKSEVVALDQYDLSDFES